MWWLLSEGTLNLMVQSMRDANVSASEIAAYETSAVSEAAFSVSGGKATINVVGVLTPKPSFMAAFFGGGNTTYPSIVSAIAEANQNADVSEIDMFFDTPGGTADVSMFAAMDAIANSEKPVNVRAVMAASAGFGLASQASRITAESRAAIFGSVGIVATAYVDDYTVQITSSNAPNKRPDLTTEEGKAVARAELDELEDLFTEQIAAGRNVSQDDVRQNYGRGGTMLADSALKRGMIDAVEASASAQGGADTSTTAQKGGETNEAKPMNLAQLKAEHPDVYAAAAAEGRAKEQDRVSAHLTLGQSCGAMDIATKAIADGSDMTQALTAQYLAAGMNKKDADARDSDDNDASNAADGADDSSADEINQQKDAEASANLLDAVATACGVTLEA